ncbi:unnamed protein product [Urochloa decumbens]|uniref:DUF7610 domain-containing protein n=1 Tax=Urochloa decumbens TaxID=240449 RepID=A0ABC9D3Q9_9POAL
MEMPPLAAAQGRRASTVVERKLDELCACLDDALSSRRRLPGAEERLAAEIKAKTDFLRSLLAAEAECHGGGARPEHLAEADARFAVLEATFDNWARRAVPPPEPEEEKEEGVGEPEEEADADGTEPTGSTCSCTGSCQEAAAGDEAAVETRKETAAADSVASKGHEAGRDAAEARSGEAASGAVTAQKRDAMGTRVDGATPPKDAFGQKRDAELEAVAETRRRTVAQQRWRRGAAWCGAAGVLAVVAIGVAELAAVARHNVNVYVVPT